MTRRSCILVATLFTQSRKLSGLVAEYPSWDWRVVGSIPCRVIAKTDPAWHSVFGVGLGGLNHPMIPLTVTFGMWQSVTFKYINKMYYCSKINVICVYIHTYVVPFKTNYIDCTDYLSIYILAHCWQGVWGVWLADRTADTMWWRSTFFFCQGWLNECERNCREWSDDRCVFATSDVFLCVSLRSLDLSWWYTSWMCAAAGLPSPSTWCDHVW